MVHVFSPPSLQEDLSKAKHGVAEASLETHVLEFVIVAGVFGVFFAVSLWLAMKKRLPKAISRRVIPLWKSLNIDIPSSESAIVLGSHQFEGMTGWL